MLLGLVVIVVSVAVLGGQSWLAPDIHPESLSRVPPVQRDSLDAEAKRVWDLIGGGRGMPKTGPAPVSMYSPITAEPIQVLNQIGRQGAVEIVATMGDYVMAGFMLTAVDQQLPPDRKPLLPPIR